MNLFKKRPLWISNWLGIRLAEVSKPLRFFERPTHEFYSGFYDIASKKYGTLDDFPENWRSGKDETASVINRFLIDNARVFSFGFGTGHIENRLSELRSDIQLYAYDFSSKARFWSLQNSRLKVMESISDASEIDMYLCVQVFYSLSDKECKNLVRQFKNIMDPCSSILVIETSAVPNENGRSMKGLKCLKRFIANVLYPLNYVYPIYLKTVKKQGLQFWGWRRENKQIINFFTEQGFVVFNQTHGADQSILEFKMGSVSK